MSSVGNNEQNIEEEGLAHEAPGMKTLLPESLLHTVPLLHSSPRPFLRVPDLKQFTNHFFQPQTGNPNACVESPLRHLLGIFQRAHSKPRSRLLHRSPHPSKGQLVQTIGYKFGKPSVSRLQLPPPLLSWLLFTVVPYLCSPTQRAASSLCGVCPARENYLLHTVDEQEH